jgi:hypothetical protein
MSEDDAVSILLELAWARGMGAACLEDRRALAETERYLVRNFDGWRGEAPPLSVAAVVSLT